jgi:diadenosine tetraphosphate (Ap4A) HIT family hydrolase
VTDCFTCRNNAAFPDLPPRELIGSDEHWRVAHATGSALPGWLVIVPRRHVTAVADLTGAEAAALGAWQWRASRALHAVTGCAKTYLVQFAEAEGYTHTHIHVIPRMPDQPEEHRGPRVFALLGRPPGEAVADADMDALAEALRPHLA